MDLRSKATTRLTDTPAIDTAPSYSPDGTQICFEIRPRRHASRSMSWRATGGAAQRISFGDGTYSTPVWSPRGDYIAFTKQAGGNFAIGVMKPDGSGERILTEGFHNEGPTFAPNGRVIMFFRDPGGNAGPVAVHGRHHRPQRAAGADAELRLRPGLVAALVMIRRWFHMSRRIETVLTIAKAFGGKHRVEGTLQGRIKVDGTFA